MNILSPYSLVQSKHIANSCDIDNNAPTIIIIQGMTQHDS